MNRRAVLVFALVGLLWGSSWIPASEVIKQVPELRAGAIRFAVAAAAIAIFLPVARRPRAEEPVRFSAPLFRNALVLGVTALALPYFLVVRASGHISSAAIPTLFAFMPFIALLLAKETISALIPALAIGICGVVMLVAQGLSFSLAQLGGALLVFCAVVSGAFSLNYAKKHLRRPDLLFSCAIQFVVATVLLGAASVATEHAPLSIDPTTVHWLLVLGIVISAVTLPLLYWLLTKFEAWQVALLQWISTLGAVAEASCLLRAGPSPGQAVGAACIIGAIFYLVSCPETVTPRSTSRAIEGSTASDCEVGSD